MGAGNKVTGKIGEGKAGPGRPKGSPNKTTAAVKDMILQALGNKGGVKYLEEQADKNPTAFLSLVGKVIPLDVNASGTLTVQIVRFGE
jgi:hypothetical protein